MDYILNKENNKLLRCKFSVRSDQVNIKVIMTITSSQTYPSRNGIHSLLHWSKPACLRRFFCFIARHLSQMFLIHHKHSNLNKNQAICDQYEVRVNCHSSQYWSFRHFYSHSNPGTKLHKHTNEQPGLLLACILTISIRIRKHVAQKISNELESH